MHEGNIQEQMPGRLGDPIFIQKFRNELAERLDDLATDPAIHGNFDDYGLRVRQSKKLPDSKIVRGVLVMLGQDYRLTPDEIEQLQLTFFEQ